MKNIIEKSSTQQLLTLEHKIERILADTLPEGTDENIPRAILELKKLFLQTIHPEQFCPKCKNQLFLEGGKYICINCGYKPSVTMKEFLTVNVQNTGKIPTNVEKLIEQTEKTRAVVPSNRGERIRKLVNQMESGNTNMTQADINKIKNQDSNIGSDINIV